MLRNNVDILSTFMIGLLASALALAHLNIAILNMVIGVLLVFVLPGYILSVALFPESTWSFMERTLLTIAISLAISVLGGIVLYALKIPLNTDTWAIFYGGIVFIFGLIGIIRRLIKQYPARRKTDRAPDSHQHLIPRFWQMSLFLLAALIVTIAMIVVQNFAKYYPNTEIVHFWMLPVENAETPTIRMGIMVNETGPKEYSIWLERGGYTVKTWAHISVQPGERWEIQVPIDINMPGHGPLEAFLYTTENSTTPYRHTILWLDQFENQ